MNKRFLKKNINSSLLKQSLPENVLHKSRFARQMRKTKVVTNHKSSKLNRVRQAEAQIVQEFAQKELKKINFQKDKGFISVTPLYKAQLSLFSSVFYLNSQKEKLGLHSIPKELAEQDVSLLLSIEQIRNMLVSKRVERQTPSELRDQLLESRKIRFIYGGLSKRELKKSIKKARRFLGNTADNLLIALESRLDVVLERCAFFSSIRLARQSVIHKRVQVNKKIINTPGYWLQPGDVIQVKALKGYSACLRHHPQACKFDTLSRAHKTLAQASKSWEHSTPPFIENGAKLSSFGPTQPASRIQKSRSQVRTVFRNNYKRPLTLFYSLLQLESLFSSICLQKNGKGLCCLHKKQRMRSHNLFTPPSSRFVLHCGARIALRSLHLDEKALSRLNMLVFMSDLYSATLNKTRSFELFAKEFVLKPNFEKSNCLYKKNLCPKILGSIFKATMPHLALHFQQILYRQKVIHTMAVKRQDAVIEKDINQQNSTTCIKKTPNFASSTSKSDYQLSQMGPIWDLCDLPEKCEESDAGLTRKNSKIKNKASNKHNEIVFFSFDNIFYHVYFYWLQLIKRLLSRNARRAKLSTHMRLSKQDLLSVKDQVLPFVFKAIKPLHLEVSYQSYNAIFLYPPQRIYLPALIDVDLLVKVL